jgi:hypothetical protein
MRVTDLAYSQVQEPPPDDDPPPDGTPPPVPTSPAPQAPETAPVLGSSVSPAAPSTQGSPGAPQNATSALESYGSPQWARSSFTHGFPGSAFIPQPDGTLRCPAGHPLYPKARRPERNGSLRVLYAASIGHCRPCPLREQCQESGTTLKPRRVSAVFWPRPAPPVTSPPAGAAPVSEADQASPPAEQVPASPPVPAQPVRLSRLATRSVPTDLCPAPANADRADLRSDHGNARSRDASFPAARNPCRACSLAPLLGTTARPQCSPSHRPISGNCASWASCTVHSGVRLPSQTRRLIHSFPLLPVLPQTVSLRPFACIHASRFFSSCLICSLPPHQTHEREEGVW